MRHCQWIRNRNPNQEGNDHELHSRHSLRVDVMIPRAVAATDFETAAGVKEEDPNEVKIKFQIVTEQIETKINFKLIYRNDAEVNRRKLSDILPDGVFSLVSFGKNTDGDGSCRAVVSKRRRVRVSLASIAIVHGGMFSNSENQCWLPAADALQLATQQFSQRATQSLFHSFPSIFLPRVAYHHVSNSGHELCVSDRL